MNRAYMGDYAPSLVSVSIADTAYPLRCYMMLPLTTAPAPELRDGSCDSAFPANHRKRRQMSHKMSTEMNGVAFTPTGNAVARHTKTPQYATARPSFSQSSQPMLLPC